MAVVFTSVIVFDHYRCSILVCRGLMTASRMDFIQYDNKLGYGLGVLIVELTRCPAELTAELEGRDILVGKIVLDGIF